MSNKAKQPGRVKRWWPTFIFPAALAVVVAVLAAADPPWWTKLVGAPDGSSRAHSPVAGFVGGCRPYQVFAQNRWKPYGTTVRAQPNVLSASVTTFPGNMSLSVDGWVHGRAAYQTNIPPFNSDIWFHLTDGIGWVGFGGVRAYPTSQDPSGLADGGPAAPAPGACQGALG